FSIDGISKSPAVFDYDKLNWFNGEYIRAMQPEDFIARAMPYIRQAFPEGERDWAVLASILQPRLTKLTQIPELLAFFRELPQYPADYFVNKKSKTNLENSKEMLTEAIRSLEGLEAWDLDSLHANLIDLAGRLGVKNGTLLWPVRIAAAGVLVTPGGAMEILALLGREEALRRLRLGLEKLNRGGTPA
ncbi:MAG TPA: glutamate--tRNA ligase, partial [Candidatus Caccousia avistercoris]|nr:glutamate--tRNA ligase [Candidatus Caccousia avistercoris]